MLSALIRRIRTRWVLLAVYLSQLWGRLLHFVSAMSTTPETDATEANTPKVPEVDEPEAREAKSNAEGFPALTDDQYNKIRKAFIESLDLDAICALASQYNNGKPCKVASKSRGSFNVCFFVEFEQEGPKWTVRIPIEPALEDPWNKLLSEVTTLQYLERNTRIPVPHVRAYGRDAKLIKTTQSMQMFLIADLIPGEPLDKKLLVRAEEEHRRGFYSQLIDILTELRKLELPSIGSLVPNPNGSPQPVLGPVISMSAATLRLPSQTTFASAKEYMRHQFGLVSGFFAPPVSDHTVEDIRQEVFALHGMERIFDQVIDPQLDEGPFVLSHLDLRSPNIIVNKNLKIQGIIDWEFASTVPRQVFTPPSWITGHDSVESNKQIHAEFRDVLNEKGESNRLCAQIRREWYDQPNVGWPGIDPTDRAFCVAHVLRRPTDVTDIFCDFFAKKLPNKDLDDTISEFFNEHQALASEVQRRAEQCERYTRYLKEKDLYETEVDRLLAASNELKAKWGWS